MGAEDWYEARRPGRGHEFREAAGAAIARIAENPLAYPDRYRGARRALVHRFPYVLWYRALPDLILVLACVHGKRDLETIRARLG